jgi:exosome complex RNA-binding protein Rrp42 (RNase PH superfamily)
MDFDLLKKLLPAECIEYTTRSDVRATDGRAPNQHRCYEVVRSVLGSQTSCQVCLGRTQLLCSLKEIEDPGYTLESGQI